VPSGGAFAVALAALAGLAGSVQVAVMGRFGERVGIFAAFVFASLIGTALGFGGLLVSDRSLRGLSDALREPAWLWTGGLFGMFIVLTVTFSPPRIGTTATVALLIAGQLAMAAASTASAGSARTRSRSRGRACSGSSCSRRARHWRSTGADGAVGRNHLRGRGRTARNGRHRR